MRYSEIISEAGPWNVGDSWQMKIKDNCSDIMAVYKRLWASDPDRSIMYRGLKRAYVRYPIFHDNSPEIRHPVDNTSEDQEKFDNFLINCNMTALRSNSTFVTSSRSHASGYGQSFAIFPVNGFDYTWTNFEDLQDMSEEIPGWAEMDNNTFKATVHPQNENIAEALTRGVEIYIHGSYYAVDALNYNSKIIELMRS